MANLTAVLLPIYITGDGVSLTAIVDLNSTAYVLSGIQNFSSAPVSVTLDAAFTALGAVDTNVASVTLLGSQVTVTFTAPFSGTVQLTLALTYPVDGSPLTTPVNQFVKVTSSALPAGATTEATLALIKAKTDNLDVALSTRTKPSDVQQIRPLTSSDVVTVAAITASLPAGTNVLGHVINDASSAVIGHVITDSGSVVNATLSAETTKVIGTVNQGTSPWVISFVAPQHVINDAGAAIIGALVAHQSTNIDQIGGVAVAAVVKGTQAAQALGVQDLKDSGRTALTFFIDNIGGSASDVLATMGITQGGAAHTPATSYTVTTGKTLRLTAIAYTVRSSTNAQQISQLRVRTAASGITAASPIILNFMGEAPSASTFTQTMALPEGYEIAGGTQIAMSHIEIVTPGSTELTVCLVGYEY